MMSAVAVSCATASAIHAVNARTFSIITSLPPRQNNANRVAAISVQLVDDTMLTFPQNDLITGLWAADVAGAVLDEFAHIAPSLQNLRGINLLRRSSQRAGSGNVISNIP